MDHNEETPNSFKIRVESDAELGAEEAALLLIEYTENYPEEAPKYDIELVDSIRLNQSDIIAFKDSLKELIGDCLGMAMVYTMAYGLKESMTARIIQKEEEKTRMENERLDKEIALEQQKFIGTPVTTETFNVWKQTFEEELAAEQSLGKLEIKKADSKKLKLNGRELFEQDRTLANSDTIFIAEGGDQVPLKV
ncbi:hypothetical protein BB561_004037 [Smittium simulii]|uniref:RWD domain-containing protein n=1 Tax=Smittium simulii TaxID=133385 RepID=A0A2T9YIC7_9FUNG|nr:hypothetical protein BB561_004037 [Smittium simulii]